MKRVPTRLRVGQLVICYWLDASWAHHVHEDERVTPVRVKTVGWIRERTDRFITLQAESFLDEHVSGDGRDVTTVTAAMLRRVIILQEEGAW